MGFKRFVNVVEVVIGITAIAFAVALFANDPEGASGGAAKEAGGAAIYAANCAVCHGSSGEGGVGPQLAGTVVAKFPDAADQVIVVTDGRSGMPAFGGNLTEAEIAEVVEYTRTDLGS